MDQTTKLNQLRHRVLQVLEMHANMPLEPAHIASRVSRDFPNETYRLMDHNPHKDGGTDYVVVELKIFDGKVWVLNDGIEYGVAEDLLEAGIAPEDIMDDYEEVPAFAYAEAQAA